MDYLDNYDIKLLEENEIGLYTKKLVEAFELEECYGLYLEDNINNLNRGNIFLGAKLIKNGLLIGGICLERKPIYKNEIYIENLFVDSKYRNQGVASNIIDYVVSNKLDLFKRNKIELYLFCEQYLEKFYKKSKFIVDDLYETNSQKVLRMKRNI